VIDEYVKLIGCRPEKIFIETTRFVDRDKKIKDTRHKQLKEDLSKFRALPEYGQLSAEINREDVIKKIKDESVYLYFRQLGKDLYTGKPIDLNDLISNNDKYEVDHIIPQSMRKNDSLENKVLTAK
jgi:CRISPR-associated endonuclease Csn1